MVSLKTAFVAVLFLSFMVFVLFFGRLPALSNTPIGALNRLFVFHVPNWLLAIDQKLTGGRLWHSSSRWFRFMMNERHPTIMITFILLMLIPECLFVPSVWKISSTVTRITMVAIIFTPYLFLYLSAYTDPGMIDPKNLNFHQSLYPYDHILFDPGRMCGTCNIIKPARSKHCRTCKRCISRCDHHCIFINSCVGYGNMHYFLLLLSTTSALVIAGTYLGTAFLLDAIRVEYPFFTLFGKGLRWNDYFTLISYSLTLDRGVGAITLLTLLMSPLVIGLTTYQLYLIWAGTTTNETSKWGNWKLDMDDGIVFRRPLDPQRERDEEFESLRVGESWPQEAVEILVRTTNGEPPSGERADTLEGEGEWEKVWTLGDVVNVYDIGFRGNLADLFFGRNSGWVS